MSRYNHIIISLTLALTFMMSGCDFLEDKLSNTESPTAHTATPSPTTSNSQSPQVTAAPTLSSPKVTVHSNDANGGLAYIDPDLDMFLYVSHPDWRYAKDHESKTVFFYPYYTDGETMFAISANTPRTPTMDNSQLDQTIYDLWNIKLQDFYNGFDNLHWEPTDMLQIGEYTATQYFFTGQYKNSNRTIIGNYLFWWTEDRLFICSFTAYPDEYEDVYSLFVESISSFKPLSMLDE